MRIAAAVILALLIGGYAFTAPLTYGYPGLDPDQLHRRRILSSWTCVTLRSADLL